MPRPKPFLCLIFGLNGWSAAIALPVAAMGVGIFVGSGDAVSDSRFGLILAVVASISSLVLGSLPWRDAADAVWMATHGQRSTVDITGHAKTSAKANGFPLWLAEWRNPDGTTGTSSRRFAATLPKVGGKVTILVDPAGRRTSRLETSIWR